LIEFNARLEKTLEKFEDTFKQDELKEAWIFYTFVCNSFASTIQMFQNFI
jgi:hypothetical protein